MLMHHSRNTEQKQWEETLTLTLAGVTKVLRSLLPSLVQMEGWEAIWEQLMEVRTDKCMSPLCHPASLRPHTHEATHVEQVMQCYCFVWMCMCLCV